MNDNIYGCVEFSKVTFTRWNMDSKRRDDYEDIKLPARATKGSAGYDFYAPYDFEIKPGESILISTGVRILMPQSFYLMIVPRSSLGFKYRLQLDNSVGIIDSDYFDSDNEGHIFAKLTNDGRENKTIHVRKGEAFMQGIIHRYYLVDNDNVAIERNGGFGSTDR